MEVKTLFLEPGLKPGMRILTWKKLSKLQLWFYIELAKRVGREKYCEYLNEISYGNNDLTEPGDDFWNFGNFGISPVNQIQFLIKLHRNDVPFSNRTDRILKEIML